MWSSDFAQMNAQLCHGRRRDFHVYPGHSLKLVLLQLEYSSAYHLHCSQVEQPAVEGISLLEAMMGEAM